MPTHVPVLVIVGPESQGCSDADDTVTVLTCPAPPIAAVVRVSNS